MHANEILSTIEVRPTALCVTTHTHAGLRRCRWPRPRNAARLASLARSWWSGNKIYYYGRQSILIWRCSRF